MAEQKIYYHRIKNDDIVARKLGFKYYEISTIFEGYRIAITFEGFTKKEAIQRFKKSQCFAYSEGRENALINFLKDGRKITRSEKNKGAES